MVGFRGGELRLRRLVVVVVVVGGGRMVLAGEMLGELLFGGEVS